MYSPNKPRPKAGYQCKICGKEGGLPDSHWFQLCPYKGQQNEATTYIPPKKGYFCKYCLKPGGEKDSHWFQQCPHYKKNYHSRHHRSAGGTTAAAMGSVGGIPQHYSSGLYHPGMPISTPGASVYDYHPHPAVAANGMILHYSQYPQAAAGLSGGQMYYMRANSATTAEQGIMPENVDPTMGIYEYAPHMYSPPYIPHTYSYPIHLGHAEMSRRQAKHTQDREATETKEETDTRRIEASQNDSKKAKGEVVDSVKQFQALDISDAAAKAKNTSGLHAESERTRVHQNINETSKVKQTAVTDSSTDSRVVIEDKQI